jgi:Leucine-rich repeat (LRR) protein
LVNLTELNYSNNQLKSLKETKNLVNLTDLDSRNNNIVEKPVIYGYEYNNGMICHETKLYYHRHCHRRRCDGEIWCEICGECHKCFPRGH